MSAELKIFYQTIFWSLERFHCPVLGVNTNFPGEWSINPIEWIRELEVSWIFPWIKCHIIPQATIHYIYWFIPNLIVSQMLCDCVTCIYDPAHWWQYSDSDRAALLLNGLSGEVRGDNTVWLEGRGRGDDIVLSNSSCTAGRGEADIMSVTEKMTAFYRPCVAGAVLQ